MVRMSPSPILILMKRTRLMCRGHRPAEGSGPERQIWPSANTRALPKASNPHETGILLLGALLLQQLCRSLE